MNGPILRRVLVQLLVHSLCLRLVAQVRGGSGGGGSGWGGMGFMVSATQPKLVDLEIALNFAERSSTAEVLNSCVIMFVV